MQEDFNNKKQTLEEVYQSYYNRNIIRNGDSCKIPLLGMVNGSKVLFVGQNPGSPHGKHLEIFQDFLNLSYLEHQKTFRVSWKQSTFVKFIARLCKETSLDFNHDIAITNMVKHWTINNTRPEISLDDQKMLACEICILQPEIVVFLSKLAANSYEYRSLYNARYLSFPHPASRRYSNEYLKEIAAVLEYILHDNKSA